MCKRRMREPANESMDPKIESSGAIPRSARRFISGGEEVLITDECGVSGYVRSQSKDRKPNGLMIDVCVISLNAIGQRAE